MGIALGMRRSKAQGTKQFAVEFNKLCDLMAGDAADGRQSVLGDRSHEARRSPPACRPGESVDELQGARSSAKRTRFTTRTSQSCKAMGRFGADVVPERRAHPHALQRRRARDGRLRHGARRDSRRGRAGQGRRRCSPTRRGRSCRARGSPRGSSCATRCRRPSSPRAWPARSCSSGGIDFVVVGADRIAANGDVANKIGTYTVAMMAHAHGVPFYVAAPLSTIDLATPDGDAIPIEQRNAREMTHLGLDAARAGGRERLESGVRRHAARAWSPASSPRGASRARRTTRACARSVRRRLRASRPLSYSIAMNVLGIETSCDETAAAVVVDDRRRRRGRGAIASNVIASQVEIHREWGGVVPEIASRQHVRDICGVVERALARCRRRLGRRRRARGHAGAGPRRLAARRRVVREGRGGGARQARSSPCTISPATSSRSSSSTAPSRCPPRCWSSRAATRACISCPSPACTDWSAARATTRRARRTTRSRGCSAWAIRAGRRSTGSRARATTQAVDLPRTAVHARGPQSAAARSRRAVSAAALEHVAEFSFSGLKTAVVRHLQRARRRRSRPGSPCRPTRVRSSPQEVADVCASFQRVVVETLVDRTFDAARLARRAQHRHRRRRVGQQPPAPRRRSRAASARACRCSSRRSRCRPTTPR